jgi:hypothetical protein
MQDLTCDIAQIQCVPINVAVVPTAQWCGLQIEREPTSIAVVPGAQAAISRVHCGNVWVGNCAMRNRQISMVAQTTPSGVETSMSVSQARTNPGGKKRLSRMPELDALVCTGDGLATVVGVAAATAVRVSILGSGIVAATTAGDAVATVAGCVRGCVAVCDWTVAGVSRSVVAAVVVFCELLSTVASLTTAGTSVTTTGAVLTAVVVVAALLLCGCTAESLRAPCVVELSADPATGVAAPLRLERSALWPDVVALALVRQAPT